MIRGQVLTTMLAVSVVDPEGNDVTPSKLVNEKSRYYSGFFCAMGSCTFSEYSL